MFTYKPLWKTLIDKNMTKTQLKEMIGISPSTLAIMGKNEYVAMSVLDRICNALDCSINDVIEHTNDKEDENK